MTGFCAVLYVGFPKAVQVAIRVCRNSFIVCQSEFRNGNIAGLQAFALSALFRLKIYPLDIMGFDHGVKDGTNGNGHIVPVFRRDGHMLFLAGVLCVGNKLLHRFSAAFDLNAGGKNLTDYVAAMLANKKSGFAHIQYLVFFIVYQTYR